MPLSQLGAHQGVRTLGPSDLPAALDLLGRNPVTNVFAEYRSRVTQLDPRWLGGEMWGYVEDGELVSMCHVGANFVPIEGTESSCRAFAARARRRERSITVVGPQTAVTELWTGLESHWGTPRDQRWNQPHLEIDTCSAVRPDPGVRRTSASDLDLLYPACVAMYTEEVGISPETDGGGDLYRARVRQLIGRGWSFSRIEDGRVIFKAEVACVTPYAAQIQGVYVDPAYRGQGLGTAGMAAVVNHALNRLAPVLSLYVNDHNIAARAAYERVGFQQTDTFATIMF